MTNGHPFVSIIIPTLNSAKTLTACLQSIKQSDYPMDRTETIIIDGASTDETVAIAKQFGCRILYEEGHGPTMARISGLKVARGEIIAFTDGDAVVETSWLKNAVAHLIDQPRTVAGGPLHADNQKAFAQALQSFFDLPEMLRIKQNHEIVHTQQEAPMLPTANFVAPAEALRCVLNERWSGYGGDHMLSTKLKGQGYKLIMYPDVKVSHMKRSNPLSAFNEAFEWGRGRVRAGHWKSANPLHYALDAFLPLSVGGMILLFMCLSTPIAITTLCILTLPLIAEAVWAGAYTRSLTVTIFSPLAVLCYAYGWSAGFLMELIVQTNIITMKKNTQQTKKVHAEGGRRQMRISFVIPAFNEQSYIADCLRSIVSLSDPAIHEIIVVDNGSTDKTVEMARAFPRVTVISEPRKGLTWARQKGLEIATGNFYAAIDADVRISPKWLKTVQQRFSEDAKLVSLTGPYQYYDLAPWKRCIIAILHWLMINQRRITGLNTQIACGGNSVYNMSVLQAAGGFNTTISFYGEDVDTLMRMRMLGKIDFDTKMTAYSSARRINAEGFWKTLLFYRISAVWQHIMDKPLLKNDERDWR